MDRVGIGIIGCGNISAAYLKAARAFPILDVKAVADLNPAAALHPRFVTPARAIAIQAVLACVMVGIGTFDTIVAYFVFISVVFIAATVASVFVQRRRDAGFLVPGYPWTPAAFLTMAVVLLGMLILTNPVQSLLGLGLVALAIPFYRIIRPMPVVPTLKEMVP